MKDFLSIMNERFAAKEFSSKRISEDDLNKIVDFGRLSPSSFGLEPWKFIVVSNNELKEKLGGACLDQKQVSQASEVFIILAKKVAFKKGSTYISDIIYSRMPEEPAKAVSNWAQSSIDAMSDEQKVSWTQMQCHLAISNMMTGAKSLGVDSCPIGGFIEEKVAKVLDIDLEEYSIALVVPFGFASKSPYPKTRLSFEEVVEFRK